MKTKFVCVTPISREAKSRFFSEMDRFHSCKIEKEENDVLYLSSLNKQYYFCVPKSGNSHWIIEK
jgi:hypothetical protein